MRKEIPGQLKVAAAILLVGGIFVATEYLLVRWYPGHRQRVSQELLKPVPYTNAALGIEVQVAAGICRKVDTFSGGVKFFRRKFWGVGPSLTITSQPNPDHTTTFSPQLRAKWQTEGVYKEIPRYRFDYTTINQRDAVFIWQLRGRTMHLTARVLSPDHLIEADCTPGQEDEDLYLEACESSLRTLKVAGPEPPPAPSPRVQQVASPAPGRKPRR